MSSRFRKTLINRYRFILELHHDAFSMIPEFQDVCELSICVQSTKQNYESRLCLIIMPGIRSFA